MEGIRLEFRLVYRGKLPAAGNNSTRMPEKHYIRCSLHDQIKQFWSVHPELIARGETGNNPGFIDRELPQYQIGEKWFLPLLTERRGLACALDILFLRREPPGRVMSNHGDIDNRLKVLFDALRVPHNADEFPRDWIQEEVELPLYCLLDDDNLITTMTVTTDRLLTPLEDGQSESDVVLIINVRAIITDFSKAPWGFIAN
jgi:hypothetical protein